MSSKKTVNVDGGVFFLLTTPLMGDPSSSRVVLHGLLITPIMMPAITFIAL